MGEKYLFDLSGEINKFLRDLKGDLGCWVITAKASDGFFKLVEKSKKYDVFSSEADFKKYGGKITDALKRAGAEYSVTLFADGASGNYAAAARYTAGEVIALGDKNFIAATADYAKKSGKVCYAALTAPDFHGLFSKTAKSAGGALKAVIVDAEILVKGSAEKLPAAYAFAALKPLDVIDYKLAVILKEKPFDEFYFLKARFLNAMLKNAFKFSNYGDVILYVALLTEAVSALSDVYAHGGGVRLKTAFAAEYADKSEGDCALYALVIGANVYRFAFLSDLRLGVFAENYNADIAAASALFNKSEAVLRADFNVPSPSALAATFRAVNGARSKLLADGDDLLISLKTYIAGYETLTGKKFDLTLFDYEKTKRAVIASTYLCGGVTVPALLRDAGVFAATE